MALNWEHIKGYNGDSTTGGRLPLYTFIEYQKGPTMGVTPPVITTLPDSYLPDIILSYANVQGTPTAGCLNCGHIITSNISNHFTKPQIFDQHTYHSTNSNAGFHSDSLIVFDDTSASPTATTYAMITRSSQQNALLLSDRTAIKLQTGVGVTEFSVQSTTAGSFGYITCGTSSIPEHIQIYGHTEMTDYCQASYFNATSDRRAKDLITPIPNNMLDIVKKMQVYTFNYKSHPSQRNIGLIAQDLKDINIDGFSLVANPNATGEDGNYMSIHESKLVYILLEAVKELSAEVDTLKDKLGE